MHKTVWPSASVSAPLSVNSDYVIFIQIMLKPFEVLSAGVALLRLELLLFTQEAILAAKQTLRINTSADLCIQCSQCSSAGHSRMRAFCPFDVHKDDRVTSL